MKHTDIKHKQLHVDIYNKHKKLSAARDFFNCSRRYANYLIVGLSLYKSNCMRLGKRNSSLGFGPARTVHKIYLHIKFG